MNQRLELITSLLVAVSICGAAFSTLLLVTSGDGDHPAAYSAYLVASTIVLSGATIATAILAKGRPDE